MADPRNPPGIWSSWLAKAAAGEAACIWYFWYRSHYWAQARPFDMPEWKAQHARMVSELASSLREQRQVIRIGDLNKFSYTTRRGWDIAGKPDLVSLPEDHQISKTGTIWGLRTGQPKVSDFIEMLLFVILVPRSGGWLSNYHLEGCILYAAGPVPLTRDMAGPDFMNAVGFWNDVLGGDRPPPPQPGYDNCHSCPLLEGCDELSTLPALQKLEGPGTLIGPF